MNNHQKLMKIIQKDPNWQDIVLEIAISNPKLVVDAFFRLHPMEKNLAEDAWVAECRHIASAGFTTNGKVRAIKFCREKTGWGLNDAKEFVESL